MTAKEYLSQIRMMDLRIKQKIDEAEDIKALAFNAGALSADGERVQTSPSGSSKQMNMIEKYIDMQEEINAEIDKFIDLKHKIINEIQALSDVRYVDILYRRYVACESFERIAVETGYDYYWVSTLHGRALKAFERTQTNTN